MSSKTPKYRISVAAKLLGISVHTLRMYEKEGLILPYKKGSKQRLYSEDDLNRLKCIRNAINEEKISIEGIKRIFSLVPCWAIVNCSIEDAKSCLALKEKNKPCWTLKHVNNFCSDRDCRECEVYNLYSDCDSIRNKIIELTFPTIKIIKNEDVLCEN